MRIYSVSLSSMSFAVSCILKSSIWKRISLSQEAYINFFWSITVYTPYIVYMYAYTRMHISAFVIMQPVVSVYARSYVKMVIIITQEWRVTWLGNKGTISIIKELYHESCNFFFLFILFVIPLLSLTPFLLPPCLKTEEFTIFLLKFDCQLG